MHKNTLLFVSFLAVIAALLVGFNWGRSLERREAAQTLPTPIPTTKPILTLHSETTCGVTFQYTNALTPMESSTSGLILANTTNPYESIVVVCQADIPRIPLTPDKIEHMTILSATGSASVSANLYHGTSETDGKPIDKLIFTHPKTGLDVFIGGFGPLFTQLIATVKLQ